MEFVSDVSFVLSVNKSLREAKEKDIRNAIKVCIEEYYDEEEMKDMADQILTCRKNEDVLNFLAKTAEKVWIDNDWLPITKETVTDLLQEAMGIRNATRSFDGEYHPDLIKESMVDDMLTQESVTNIVRTMCEDDDLEKMYSVYAERHADPYAEEGPEDLDDGSQEIDDPDRMHMASDLAKFVIEYHKSMNVNGWDLTPTRVLEVLKLLFDDQAVARIGCNCEPESIKGIMERTGFDGDYAECVVTDYPTSHDNTMTVIQACEPNEWFELDHDDFIQPFTDAPKAYRMVLKKPFEVNWRVYDAGQRCGYISDDTFIEINKYGPVGIVLDSAAVISSALVEAGFRPDDYDHCGSGYMGTITVGGHACVYGSVLENDKHDSSGSPDCYQRPLDIMGNAIIIDCRLQGCGVLGHPTLVNIETRNSLFQDNAVVVGSSKNGEHVYNQFFSPKGKAVLVATVVAGETYMFNVTGAMTGGQLRDGKCYQEKRSFICDSYISGKDLTELDGIGYNVTSIIDQENK